MIQEYLFSDNSKRTEIEKYTPKDVDIEITNIKNSDCWIITYSIPHTDEAAAKKLSEINQYIINSFNPIVLSNESAAYFNKRLYPFANKFERKLRKLLYFKSALNPDDKASENIKDLEKKDLGEIFELLFTDIAFIKTVKSKINEKTWQFTKAELYDTINNIGEDTAWNRLIGEDAVPDLSSHYVALKTFRNDIMHAHNISYKTYQEAKKLIETVNKQLDIEIGKIIAVVEQPSQDKHVSNYNTALNNVINNMRMAASFANLAQDVAAIQANLTPALQQMQETLSQIPKVSKEQYESLLHFSDLLKDIIPYDELQILKEIQPDQQDKQKPSKEELETNLEESQQDNLEEDSNK